MKMKASPARSPKTPAQVIRPKAAVVALNAAFPIVGIGASAGGLEALEQFLKNVPAGSGMAFVIVQHLDPTRRGVMSELLQRATSMKVVQAKERTVVRPDCVYVIPPLEARLRKNQACLEQHATKPSTKLKQRKRNAKP